MDADLEYWIKELEGNQEVLRELKYYNLPHRTHSITELHELRQAIEDQTVHAELLIRTLRDRDTKSKKSFWKKIFRK